MQDPGNSRACRNALRRGTEPPACSVWLPSGAPFVRHEAVPLTAAPPAAPGPAPTPAEVPPPPQPPAVPETPPPEIDDPQVPDSPVPVREPPAMPPPMAVWLH